MEHCIDIEEGTVNDGSNYIVQKIKDLCGLPFLDLNCCIHRVSEGLCKAKREAYEPMVVSIGPYHLKNPKLKAMTKHKLRYLHLLLERRMENMDRYVVELKKLEDRVRKCYVEPIDDLNSDDFVEMMLLDACFIIEFFRKESRNAILDVDCMEFQICRDLMLLENQLPFFLLSHFYDMTENPYDDPDNNPNNGLLRLIAPSFFSHIIPPPCLKYDDPKCPKHDIDPREIKHLVHLVHVICRPNTKQTASSELNMPKLDLDILNPMHSAVELEEAGVKFNVLGEYYNSTAHLFDIKFEDGVMEVPCFSVEDSTDTFFRNLIAFEQHSMDIVPKYFTEYVDFMDTLISSENDAKLLRHKGIIANFLGDDNEVSNLFNNLVDGVMVSLPNSYSDVRMKANKHCKKPWNRIRADLMHNYFNTSRGRILSFGGTAMFVLTLLQTIKSFENKL